MDNKPQIPAQGIMLYRDWGKAKMYKIHCDCGNPEHELTMDIEANESNVTLEFYVKVESNWWDEKWKKRYDIKSGFLQSVQWAAAHFVNTLWTRIKLTWRLWAKGYLEYEQAIVMNEQQALNLSHAIGDAILDVKAFRDEHRKQ